MDKETAVKTAIQAVMDAVQGADARDMVGQRKPAMDDGDGDEASPGADCEACKTGACDDPDHMKPDDLEALLGQGQDAG
jgi:hypothetical protein